MQEPQPEQEPDAEVADQRERAMASNSDTDKFVRVCVRVCPCTLASVYAGLFVTL